MNTSFGHSSRSCALLPSHIGGIAFEPNEGDASRVSAIVAGEVKREAGNTLKARGPEKRVGQGGEEGKPLTFWSPKVLTSPHTAASIDLAAKSSSGQSIVRRSNLHAALLHHAYFAYLLFHRKF